MIWIEYLPAALVAFLVVLIAVLPLAALGRHYGWVYRHARSSHHLETPEVPYVGGVAILLGLIAAAVVSSWPFEAFGLAIGMVVVFVFGVLEDRTPIRRRFWFGAMAAGAAAAVIGGQHMITTTGPLFGPFEIPLSVMSLPFTIAFVGVIALGFRTIDRADGLCDGQALVSTLALMAVAIILALQGSSAWPMPAFALVSMSVLGALLASLIYTLRRPGRRLATVYLGSAGAMMLGLVLGWLALQIHAGFGEEGIGLGGLLWLFAIPLTDLVIYALRRLTMGRQWQAEDKFRFYHWLKAQQFTVGQAVMITHGAALAAAIIGIGGWQLGLPDFLLFWGFCVALAAYALVALSFWSAQAVVQKNDLAHWHTGLVEEEEDGSVTIDIDAHTVMGSFEEPGNPHGFKPANDPSHRPG